MKTSMLGSKKREKYRELWPVSVLSAAQDRHGDFLQPGDLVTLSSARYSDDSAAPMTPGVIQGYAIGKHRDPMVVVSCACWTGTKFDSWKTWLAPSSKCVKATERRAKTALRQLENAGMERRFLPKVPPTDELEILTREWKSIMAGEVRDALGVLTQPGDLFRVPRWTAGRRGSQLHTAGTLLGYAVGMDGGHCAVVDAVGSDNLPTVKWRTWLIKLSEGVVTEQERAWELEARFYPRKRSFGTDPASQGDLR